MTSQGPPTWESSPDQAFEAVENETAVLLFLLLCITSDPPIGEVRGSRKTSNVICRPSGHAGLFQKLVRLSLWQPRNTRPARGLQGSVWASGVTLPFSPSSAKPSARQAPVSSLDEAALLEVTLSSAHLLEVAPLALPGQSRKL